MGIEKRPGICKECGAATAWHVPQDDCTLCNMRKALSLRDEIFSRMIDFAHGQSSSLEQAIREILTAEHVPVPESGGSQKTPA